MKVLKVILLIFGAWLIMTSCKVIEQSKEKEIVHTTHTYVDSTFVSKKEIIDTAWIRSSYASDSINYELLKELGRFTISNDRAHTTIIYDTITNQLYVDTKCDSAFQIYIKSLYEEFSMRISKDLSLQLESKLESKTITKTSFKAYLIGGVIGGIMVGLLVIFIYFYRKIKI